MRKIDYQTLAELIAAERDTQSRALIGAPDHSHAADIAHARAAAVAQLAREFARRASVNPDEFLRACGLHRR